LSKDFVIRNKLIISPRAYVLLDRKLAGSNINIEDIAFSGVEVVMDVFVIDHLGYYFDDEGRMTTVIFDELKPEPIKIPWYKKVYRWVRSII
jgi:hypothetical protein